MMIRFAALTLSLAGGLLAQGAPQTVLRKTPPPQDPVQTADNPGAYTLKDGSVILPDGTRLKAAQDPYAPAQAKPVNPPTGALARATSVTGMTPEEAVAAYAEQQRGENAQIQSQRMAQAASAESQDAEQFRVGQAQSTSQAQPTIFSLFNQPQGGAKRGDDGLAVDPEGDYRRQLRAKTASQVAQDSGMALVPAGAILQLRTENAINTQLGGTCLGFVERDILDTTRRYVAIPRGSKILAAVQPVFSEGQNRAAVVVRQVVLPNGDQIPLFVPEPATDGEGTPGVPGSVNRHLGLKLFTPLVWGFISGALAPKDVPSGLASLAGNQRTSTSDVIRSNIANQYGQTGQDYLSRVQGIPPEINVPKNSSMKVILTGPVYVRPWRQRLPNGF